MAEPEGILDMAKRTTRGKVYRLSELNGSELCFFTTKDDPDAYVTQSWETPLHEAMEGSMRLKSGAMPMPWVMVASMIRNDELTDMTEKWRKEHAANVIKRRYAKYVAKTGRSENIFHICSRYDFK